MTSPVATSDASPRSSTDRCGWCAGPIPPGSRSDARYCGQRCRQSAWRFARGARRRQAATEPMRLAYADPPYPGLARYYLAHEDYAGEVDHRELVGFLEERFPAGWALSTSAASLPEVLAVCPQGVRVAAWVRGERPTASWAPLNAWEPVIFRGGRPWDPSAVDRARRVDVLVHHARPRRSDPAHVIGAKPAAFAYWLFELLGALPGDELVDLFPGSGGIGRAWDVYASKASLEDPPDASAAATANGSEEGPR